MEFLPRALYAALNEEKRREWRLLEEWMAWPSWYLREQGRLIAYRPCPPEWQRRDEDLMQLCKLLGKNGYTHWEPLPNHAELLAKDRLIPIPGFRTKPPAPPAPTRAHDAEFTDPYASEEEDG